MTATDMRLWTVSEYRRMTETGILDPDERVELIDGQIISMSAKNPPHAATNLCAANYLRNLLLGLALIRIQDPVTLSAISEPEPDIAVVQIEPRFYQDFHPAPANIFLLVEVADTTLERDRNRKASAYARAGIADYWILDVNARQVYVFREPAGGSYRQETIFNEGDVLSMLAFPEIEVLISQLFP
ncbi:MAG: Uma2 family endonuclease [Richelia sp. CSU_2_1]|nr:Uma2 family endonuclease [Microcoleus sp. SU_5_6]NJL66101.1 Uma2 family endonuclease [Microcoleus sp. SM1_3_4]NJR25087.1 Uma2 family endonuclease [Richelia sp. CSU_2_1]